LGGKNSVVIVVNENGKTPDLQPNGVIEKALNKGQMALSIDVSNTGELKDNQKSQYDNDEFGVAKMAIYEGKTLMTYRAEDILMAIGYLENLSVVDKDNVEIISTGRTDAAALHAGIIGQNIKKITLINSSTDWIKQASSYASTNQLANVVPNVLNYYDLTDLPSLMPGTTVSYVK
jgi:hypothetical protein